MPFSIPRREPVVVFNHPSIADAQAPRHSYHSPEVALEQFVGSWLASCALARSPLRGRSNRHHQVNQDRRDRALGAAKLGACYGTEAGRVKARTEAFRPGE